MSIRHIVLWKLAADDADTRALHAEQMEERLMALPAQIDEIEHFEVGRNVAYPQTNWDIVLVSEFADVALSSVTRCTRPIRTWRSSSAPSSPSARASTFPPDPRSPRSLS